MNDSKLWAAAHQMAVATASTMYQKSTGYRPKYAAKATIIGPAAPSMKTFPTWE